MKEELFKDLKNRYEMAKTAVNALGDAAYWYDIRLVSIRVLDDYESKEAHYAIDVRLRKLQEDGFEKITMLIWEHPNDNNCLGTEEPTGDDVDKTLDNTAALLEEFTIMLTDVFNDKVLDWHWLGD